MGEKFNNTLEPEFFIFTSPGFGNCYLWQNSPFSDFYAAITGYTDVIDFIYQNEDLACEDKLYPLIYMFRNDIELCLKRLFYSRVENGVPLNVFMAKRKSHYIKKDLWKNVKNVITSYGTSSAEELQTIEVVEKLLDEINNVDKNGDTFRYPTSYSLEYRLDNRMIDLSNVYLCLRSIISFLDDCDSQLDAFAEYEQEIRHEYESDMYL
ncbi:hypothetical protein [Limosilactobacillus fermentum]|uniref:hypothetical protein n=1 Tax=Limosilactobacillus fermentum TaxID=1613 RepID=UPI0027CBE756|nr:hypothetical protein [Limosilactobacillus fermentum]MDQ2153044.1 hypothetical protein [Limosilactobacillus fermentum]